MTTQLMKTALRNCLSRIGYEVVRVPAETNAPVLYEPRVAYVENPEAGPINLPCKLQRVANGGPFEWPNIVALNQAVVSLVGDAKQIVELGAGTGCFALHASEDTSRQIVACDFDAQAISWAQANRARPNITFTTERITPEQGPFDLLVSIEVIEHVADYVGFLNACRSLAPRALLTTPNRKRNAGADHAGPPVYEQHVREWSAGEFYWVLHSFYQEVTLYALEDDFKPVTCKVDVDTTRTPLIADCRYPIGSSS